MQTFRRLNDGVRYNGLTIGQMFGIFVAGAMTYGAVRISPFGFKPTVTICVMVAAGATGILLALQGQAMGPGRYLMAMVRWRLGRRYYDASDQGVPKRGGVVVDFVPPELLRDAGGPIEWDDEVEAHPTLSTEGVTR